jgi:hypothetical protein
MHVLVAASHVVLPVQPQVKPPPSLAWQESGCALRLVAQGLQLQLLQTAQGARQEAASHSVSKYCA